MNTLKNQVPVWDGKKTIGYTTSNGYRKAKQIFMKALGGDRCEANTSVKFQRVETPIGNVVCWVLI